jgi:hypothetical protein
MKMFAALAALLVALSIETADAQTYYYSYYAPSVAYSPVITTPTVSYYGSSYVAPITSYYAPTTAYYATPVTSYYTPAYTSYYTPTYTSYYTPTYTSYYAPTYTSYYSTSVATPVTSYYAPVTTYYSPAVVGSSIYGTPRAYVPGQPVRNVLRSVLP